MMSDRTAVTLCIMTTGKLRHLDALDNIFWIFKEPLIPGSIFRPVISLWSVSSNITHAVTTVQRTGWVSQKMCPLIFSKFENRSVHHLELFLKHNFVLMFCLSAHDKHDTLYVTKFTFELFSRYWGLHQPRPRGGWAQGPEVSVSTVQDVQDYGDQADGRRLEGGLSALCGGQTEQTAQAGTRGRGAVLQVECLIRTIWFFQRE